MVAAERRALKTCRRRPRPLLVLFRFAPPLLGEPPPAYSSLLHGGALGSRATRGEKITDSGAKDGWGEQKKKKNRWKRDVRKNSGGLGGLSLIRNGRTHRRPHVPRLRTTNYLPQKHELPALRTGGLRPSHNTRIAPPLLLRLRQDTRTMKICWQQPPHLGPPHAMISTSVTPTTQKGIQASSNPAPATTRVSPHRGTASVAAPRAHPPL